MIKLAIRDDDMNFFTKVEDIVNLYSQLPEFPISFAVIPTVIDVSSVGACSDTRGNTTPMCVFNNIELIQWLKNKVADGKCDILMHGITHQYKFIDGKRLPEMLWRENEIDLIEKLVYWKKRYSNEFNYNLTSFVAPSNLITKLCIAAVANAGMNYSGIVPITFYRDFTLKNIINYVKRWYCRFVYRLPYPNVLTYTSHKEVNACLLQSEDYLYRMFDYCCRIKSPMVINVHYWHLRDNPREMSMLINFVKYALGKRAIPTKLTDLF